MASIKSQRFTTPKPSNCDGRAVFINDKVALAANPSAADTLDFRIPAGTEISYLAVKSDDLDTNGAPTFVFGVGYAPVDSASSLAANATYFAAAGQTIAQTGGGLVCTFKPITFQEDVMVRLTVGTASATFAAGEIHVTVGGNCVGVR